MSLFKLLTCNTMGIAYPMGQFGLTTNWNGSPVLLSLGDKLPYETGSVVRIVMYSSDDESVA